MSEYTSPSDKQAPSAEPEQAQPLEGPLEGGYPQWWVSSPALSFFAKHQRLLSSLIALMVMTALGGGLVVSQISAHHGLLVFGSPPEHWSAGSQTALRVEARALSLGHRAAILSASARFESPHLPSPPPQALKQGLGLSLQGTIQLPSAPGDWTLIIDAEAISAQGLKGDSLKVGLSKTPLNRALRLGERVPLQATLPLKLSAPSSPSGFSALEPARSPDLLKARAPDASAVVKSFAADQRLSFELPSTLLILSLDPAGVPLTGSLNVSMNGDPSARHPVGPDGITALTVTPRSPTIDLKVSFEEVSLEGDARAETYERVWPEAHQFGLDSSAQLLRVGEGALLTLKSTQPAEGLFVDLWWGPRWLSTFIAPLNSAGEGQLHLSPPAFTRWSPELGSRPALLWVQAYLSPYQPGETRGGRYLLYQPPQMSAEELGAWLLEQTERLKVTQTTWPQLSPERWVEPLPLRLILGRVERPKGDPTLIINSVASAEATATLLKRKYQGLFFLFMAGLCLVILIGLGWLMSAHQRSLAPLREELNLKGHALWWFAQVSLILLCFFGGMIYLVYTIRW